MSQAGFNGGMGSPPQFRLRRTAAVAHRDGRASWLAFALPSLARLPALRSPLGIALAAFGLALSPTAAQLLEFAPEVLAGDVILPRRPGPAAG